MRHPQCVPSLANISLLLAYNKVNCLFGADKHCMSNANKHKSKPVNFSGLNTVGNIWDDVSTQLNTRYNRGRVVCRQFDAESQHVISLKGLTLTLTLISSHNQVEMIM